MGQPASAALDPSRAALYTQSLKLVLSTLLQPEDFTPRLSAFRWTLLAGSDQYVDTGFNVPLISGSPSAASVAAVGGDLLDFQKDATSVPKQPAPYASPKGKRDQSGAKTSSSGVRPKVVSVAGSGSTARGDAEGPWKPILNRIFLLLNQLCGLYDPFDMVRKFYILDILSFYCFWCTLYY